MIGGNANACQGDPQIICVLVDFRLGGRSAGESRNGSPDGVDGGSRTYFLGRKRASRYERVIPVALMMLLFDHMPANDTPVGAFVFHWRSDADFSLVRLLRAASMIQQLNLLLPLGRGERAGF